MKDRLYKFCITLISIPCMCVVIPIVLIGTLTKMFATQLFLLGVSLILPIVSLIAPDCIQITSPWDITFNFGRKESG